MNQVVNRQVDLPVQDILDLFATTQLTVDAIEGGAEVDDKGVGRDVALAQTLFAQRFGLLVAPFVMRVVLLLEEIGTDLLEIHSGPFIVVSLQPLPISRETVIQSR